MKRRKGGVAAFLAVVAAALVAPATAGAAITFGSNLSQPALVSQTPPNDITVAHHALPPESTAAGGMRAPISGVIVRWRIKVASPTTAVALRLTRPGDSTTRTGAGTSETVTPSANAISEFSTRLPVQAGDALGLDWKFNQQLTAQSNPPGASVLMWLPQLADGGPPRAADADGPFELLVNADVEPDCDNDGFGDETQDPELTGPNCPQPQPEPTSQAKANRTVTLDANKNKVKKGKKVTLSGQVNEIVRQGPCESGQTVQLQRKRPKATTFTTVQELQTDAGGSFSRKRKVKKTFEYRAQLPDTATCAGQTSNTEKVKVKKKK